MTRRLWKHVLFVLLIFIESSLGMPFVHQGDGSGESGENDSRQTANLVVLIEGQVSVKRKGWSTYAPLVFGSNLEPGDLLHLDQSSHAKVVCSDLTLHDVQPGIAGVPCVRSQPLLRRAGGSVIDATRGWPSDGSFPMVLSPRKTKILSPNPILRWTPVQGATVYSVIVRGATLYWVSRVRTSTEILYPQKAPRLESGQDYKLIVNVDDRSSSAEPGLGLGFSLLDVKDRKKVLREENQIKDLRLSEGPTQFLIAHLYATYRLNAEAIQRLESISPKFKVAAVERFLGNLYVEIGLTRQAEAHYLTSLALSGNEKDEEGEMLDHLALARIYEQALGNPKSAGEHLDATLVLAIKLGDDRTASEAKKALRELNKGGT